MRPCAVLGLFLLASGACAHARPQGGRFLYEISCAAVVDRFDSIERRHTDHYDLARRSGDPPLVPAATGTLDVCLVNRPLFDPGASVFYAVVPTQGHPQSDGTLDYRVLAFSVPGINFVKQLPGGQRLDQPPDLTLGPGGIVRVSPTPAILRTEEDLATFGPARRALPNRILETSGDRTLLRLYDADGAPIFAVALGESRTLVRLQGPIVTTAENVHLAPGGTHVLVEETALSGAKAVKTGRARLYDASTGAVMKTFDDPRIARLVFRAIAPTGVALYQLHDESWFLDLGASFGPDAVARPVLEDFPAPVVFFADR
jgi:hypothetical protein